MNYKALHFISLISLGSIIFAYTQNDLLTAQTNYQNAKSNNFKLKEQLQKAKDDQIEAESALQKAESKVIEAKKDLILKKAALIQLQKDYESSNRILNEAKTGVNTVWNQLNNNNSH